MTQGMGSFPSGLWGPRLNSGFDSSKLLLVNEKAQLREILKKYFGFVSFGPLQEEIIHDTLAGKDVFAVLPTGGGKS